MIKEGFYLFPYLLLKLSTESEKLGAFSENKVCTLKIIVIKTKENESFVPRIIFLDFFFKRFNWFLVVNNDFENQKCAIFGGSVHNFGWRFKNS